MRIVVCIKQVPEEAELKTEEGRWTLAREGVPNRISDGDLDALEVALRLRDQHGGEVTALSMGPASSEEALREAMAMGVAKGILLSDPALAGADTLATSTALARAINRLGSLPELVLCGTRTSDSGTGQVGLQLAEELGIPHVAYVENVEKTDDAFRVRRRVDRYRETFKVRPPALLTILKSPNPPREVPFAMIEEAFAQREILFWGIKELDLRIHQVGHRGSATWVKMIREPQGTRSASLIHGTPHEVVDAIMQALSERYVLD